MSPTDRPSGDARRRLSQLSAIVITESIETGDRVATVLAEQGLPQSLEIDAPGELAGSDIDPFTIIIFVCDIETPRGMADLRRLCRQTRPAATVVISPPATGGGVRRALDAGADALVFDSELELTLAAAIHAVASGQSVVPRKLRASVERPTLSHREIQVLLLVRQGLTNAEIAGHLFLAESTVKSHLASVFTKFGVHSRKEAAAVFADLERASGARHAVALRTPLEQTTA